MRWQLAALTLVLSAGLAGCSRTDSSPKEVAQACEQIQSQLDSADSDFVARVQQIRAEHILIVEYDRKMIAALRAYRDKVKRTFEEQENGSGRLHCTGKLLADVELAESPRLQRVGHYLIDFERALSQDPPNQYLQ